MKVKCHICGKELDAPKACTKEKKEPPTIAIEDPFINQVFYCEDCINII